MSAVRPDQSAAQLCPPRALLLPFLVLVALIATAAPAPPAARAQQATASGVVVTSWATGEPLEAAAGALAGGIMVHLNLENRTGADVSGLRLRAPLPPNTRVAQTWGAGATVDGQSVTWSGATLPSGGYPLIAALRLTPAEGAVGATLFRQASIMPEVSWTGPTAGRATPPPLKLNGLWGEAGFRRTVLASGLTILTRERPDSPSVFLKAAVRAGSRDEDEITRGGSHWLEHAHFLGTARRPQGTLETAIADVGGFANASTSSEWTDYFKLVPAENFDLALDVLADELLNSTFPREAFDRERLVVSEEIKRALNNTSGTATREFQRLVFAQSPLRRDVLGTAESVAQIPIATILAYREQRYVTGNMVVTAIGNLRHDEAVAKIARAFASLPVGPRAERAVVAEPPQTEPRRLELGQGSRLSEIRLGWPVPGDNHPDGPAMEIIQDILGPIGRRLAEEISDRQGLANNPNAGYLQFSDAGSLILVASTVPEREAAVIEALLGQIRRLRAGDLTDAEVRAVVRAQLGQSALSNDSNQNQAYAANIEVSSTLESDEEYTARLRAVTAADVIRVARFWLNPDAYTLVIARA